MRNYTKLISAILLAVTLFSATTHAAHSKTSPTPTSAWSPLRISVFGALWIASVVSNISTWMQDVGESWLMTSLTLSPLLVALVETAGSLPVVLAALPAGALADIVDRRRLLLFMQAWMGIVAVGARSQQKEILAQVDLHKLGSCVFQPT